MTDEPGTIVFGFTGRNLTPRIVIELIAHEGIVREAYKDSRGIWTWSVGLAVTGGWPVMQYRDNPASLETCLEAYIEALRTQYLPDVLRAFPEPLEEHQMGAALSFAYNTGAIGRASWVALWNKGDVAGARKAFLNWSSPSEIIPRRKAERDLFFDGKWSGNGTALVYDVLKPSYKPTNGRRVEVGGIIQRLLS